ncbi:MAG: glycosyltransferase [Alphaproteobacteria bacterium]|nr:glycosyltransferase [Alphaproteobacteria bacterium]
MSKCPEITVIMPVYNVEKYLRASLDSVLGQSFKDFKLICINDAGTDGSWDIAREYAAADARIKLMEHEKNEGISATRNTGLGVVSGGYVMFVDSDDTIHPQVLEIALYFAKKHNADIVGWRMKYLWEPGDKISVVAYDNFDDIPIELTDNPVWKWGQGSLNSSCNKLWRRSVIGHARFIPGIRYEDSPFVLEILYKNPKTVILNAPLYNYVCYNSASFTRERFCEKNFSDYNKVFRAIYDVWKDAPGTETRFITDHLFKESKNFLRAIRRRKYPESIKRAFANMIADIDGVGWLKMPKDLHKLDKIKHLIRLKYYIRKYADRRE